MKKTIIMCSLFVLLLLTGCQKYGEKEIVSELTKKTKDISSYQIKGKLEVTNNDDTYNYDVTVSHESPNKYRVSLINKSNDHEQIILKNDDGVYVVTPSLNKSFKFQSDWPNNNSQIYLLSAIVNDINNDNERTFEENNNKYIFTTKVNYPNNIDLVKQKVYLDKDLTITRVEVLDNNDIPKMIMTYDTIDYKPNFNDNYFDLESIIQKSEEQLPSGTESSSTLNDIIYPLYIPTGTALVDQEKINKTKGERVILTFDGEKPFLLVEETVDITDEFSIIPIYGEPYLLIDTVGALSDKSITWVSNGIEYYIASETMSQLELIEVASSIATIPTMK